MFSFLNCDNANIKRFNEVDSYGEAINPIILNIKGKMEYKFKKIINKTGAEVVASGTFRTEEEIKQNDLIEINGDFREFIEVQPQTDFSGNIVYYIGWF